jgi:biopolymer transport protein ExbB
VEAAPSSASAPADATPAAAPAAPAPADVPPATPLAAPEPGQPEALQPAHADHGADAAAPGAAPVAKSTDAAHLPRDLSPWNMFMSADIVVKAVMIGLAFASVVTWTVWLAKSIELTWAKRRLIQAFSEINASHSLAEAAQRLGGRKGIVSGLIDLAAIELRLSADVSDKAGIKERVSSRLDGLAAAAGRDMNRGTGVLATIGSTSPFVGLFGTVWGIMNSFIGISEAQTTNLAIVAPGIAEALLATAIGLVAAIPAVIIYNQFARSIAGYRAIIAEASAEVMRLVSRDLDRGYKVGPARAAE